MGAGYGKWAKRGDRSRVAEFGRVSVHKAQPLHRVAEIIRRAVEPVRAKADRWGRIAWARFRALQLRSKFEESLLYDSEGCIRAVEIGYWKSALINPVSLGRSIYFGKTWVLMATFYREEFNEETGLWTRVK